MGDYLTGNGAKWGIFGVFGAKFINQVRYVRLTYYNIFKKIKIRFCIFYFFVENLKGQANMPNLL